MPCPLVGWLLLSCMDPFPSAMDTDAQDPVATDTDTGPIVEPPVSLRVQVPAEADDVLASGPGGAVVVGLGDLSGDGAEDFGVAEIYATVDGDAGAGRVQLLLGDPLAPYAPVIGPAWLGGGPDERLGATALDAGDVDGDGDPELLLGGSGFWLIEEPLLGGPVRSSAQWFMGDGAGQLADIDGDGLQDVILRRTGSQAQVAVWLGPPQSSFGPDHVATGAIEDRFGTTVAAGDLDGDGRDELAIGASLAGDHDEGAVYVYDADDLGLDRPGATISGALRERVGTAVAIPGDIDGDGLGDLLVGAYAHDGLGGCAAITQDVAGALFLGPVSGGALEDGHARFTWNGPGCGQQGETLGDLDGDGMPEIAMQADDSAWIFLDAPSGSVALDAAQLRVDGPLGCCTVGDADVNGDGARDLLVGRKAVGDPYAQPGEVYVLLDPLN